MVDGMAFRAQRANEGGGGIPPSNKRNASAARISTPCMQGSVFFCSWIKCKLARLMLTCSAGQVTVSRSLYPHEKSLVSSG